jgi:hypothetical protein
VTRSRTSSTTGSYESHASETAARAPAAGPSAESMHTSTPRRFGMRQALERVEEHEPVLAGGQALGGALKKLP